MEENKPVVLLVHGAIIPAKSVDFPFPKALQLLGKDSWGPYLRRAGYDTRVVAYKSVREGTAGAIEQIRIALEELPVGEPIRIVAHSFGGPTSYLALQEFLKGKSPAVAPKLVCVGSPFQGSVIARTAHKLPFAHYLVQHTMDVLGAGIAYDPLTNIEMGRIIGTRAQGGWNSILRVIPKEFDHDGCIAMHETEFDGFIGEAEVCLSHEGMLFSPDVPKLIENFLRQGSFVVKPN